MIERLLPKSAPGEEGALTQVVVNPTDTIFQELSWRRYEQTFYSTEITVR